MEMYQWPASQKCKNEESKKDADEIGGEYEDVNNEDATGDDNDDDDDDDDDRDDKEDEEARSGGGFEPAARRTCMEEGDT